FSPAALEEMAGTEGLDPERAVKLLMLLSGHYSFNLELAPMRRAIESIDQLADRLGDFWRPRALAEVASGYQLLGEMERANALYDALLSNSDVVCSYAEYFLWVERYDDVREALEDSTARARAEGNILRIAW